MYLVHTETKMASTNSIILYSNFDTTLINFDPVSKNKNGGKMCYMSYGPSKKRIYVQTPANLACPFGISKYEDVKTGEVSYSLDATFRDMDSDPKMKLFHDKMDELNERILTEAVKNSGEWFGKPMSKDVIQEFYRNIIKLPKDPSKYAPILKIKIPMSNGQPNVDIFSEDKEKVDIQYVTKGSTLRCIMELKAIWFINKNFGVTWQLVQAGVTTRPQKFEGWAFKDDDENDDEADF